jgi:hypothetical protein
MGGGLLQLVAYGAQDAYITGNPQITFWKGLYKRHTNFAMEPFRINFSGQAQWGTKQTAIIGRHADLLYSTYLQVELPQKDKNNVNYIWNNEASSLGFNLISRIELDIGGQIIDRLYSEWLFLWSNLTSDFFKAYKRIGLISGDCVTSGATALRNSAGCQTTTGRQAKPNVFYVPLDFFFTKNPGAALPLIALQYHEVKINVYWNTAEFIAGNFVSTASGNGLANLPQASSAALYVDYIYLDTEERRRMAQASHEYLIEQVQFNEDKGIVGANNRIDLTFNHPVKEVVWVVQPSYYRDCSLMKGFTGDQTRLKPFTFDLDPVYEQWIQINGQDRLDRRYGSYYSKVQAYQHHSGSANLIAAFDGIGSGGVYSYSFALKPEENQPSGTCNFSRIDTATIVMNFDNTAISDNPDNENWDVRVYAVNYNVLRVMSGMGGLAYSN